VWNLLCKHSEILKNENAAHLGRKRTTQFTGPTETIAKIAPNQDVASLRMQIWFDQYPHIWGSGMATPQTVTDPQVQQNVVSLYINAYIAVLSPQLSAILYNHLDSLEEEGKIEYSASTPAENALFRDTPLPLDRTIFMAFFATASLAKTDTAQGIPQRVKRRTGALFARLVLTPPPSIEDITNDINILSRYLSSNLEIRAALLAPLLFNEYGKLKLDARDMALRSQVGLVLSWYAMSTFRLGIIFTTTAETGAHLIPEVIRECEKILDEESTLKDLCKNKDYSIEYYCIFNERRPTLETNNYPHLIYCAVTYQKAIMGGSWENYQMGTLSTTVTTVRLDRAVSEKLQLKGTPESQVNEDFKKLFNRLGKSIEVEEVILDDSIYKSIRSKH